MLSPTILKRFNGLPEIPWSCLTIAAIAFPRPQFS